MGGVCHALIIQQWPSIILLYLDIHYVQYPEDVCPDRSWKKMIAEETLTECAWAQEVVWFLESLCLTKRSKERISIILYTAAAVCMYVPESPLFQ